jgi:hypothetical protein
MLPRPPACCRAVQRQLLRPSDSIWVSDNVLGHAFQRFVTALRTGKRYGSFVPGPLESRRRLGKRRMAHLSEPIPPSAFNLGPLWGFFEEVDNTQWRWEAPATRKPRESSTPALPTWHQDLDTPPQVLPESIPVEQSIDNHIEEPAPIERDIINFRRSLRAANPNEVAELCNQFNRRLKQSLVLGLVSEETIYDALKTVSREMRIAFSKSGLIADQHLLAFFQAFWDGLGACKVLQLVELDGKILDRFLFLLGPLVICPEAQTLLHGIMHTASVTQLGKMSMGLRNLVKVWVRSWLDEQQVGNPGLCGGAEQALSESATKLVHLHDLTNARDTHLHVELDLAIIQKAFQEAKASIDNSIKAIIEAEKAIHPIKGSVDALSHVLGYLPSGLLRALIDSCTRQIIDIYNDTETPNADIHYGWLSLVAKLPEVDDRIFVDILKRIKECKRAPECSVPGDVLLSRWASRGDLAQEPLIRNTFEISEFDGRPLDLELVRLLFAIDKHREGVFSRTKALFKLLEDLGEYKDVYVVLSGMWDLGMKLPADIISPAIEILSKHDLKLSHLVFKLYHSQKRFSVLRPYHTPNFVISMINHARFHPREIWGVLRVPFYEGMGPQGKLKSSERHLPPAMIKLMTQVAIAFAHSDARPQRVAFRNVVQCLHHLRRNRASVTPELTRAISHAGFTRKINAGQWISKDLLSWALGLIEWAEGREVAVMAERAVTYWNEKLEGKQQKETRETNVLRVGQID